MARFSACLRIVFAGALCASLSVLAHEGEQFDSYLGLGIRGRPAYEGASTNRGQVIPYLRWYGDYLFARTTQGILEAGVRTRPLSGVVLGAQLAYEDGRIAEESNFLKAHNFEDIDPGASLGVHAEGDWKFGPVPLNALLRYRRNVDSDLGAQADLRVTAGVYSRAGFNAGVFAQRTWSDDKATLRYFGIDSQQSVRTGLPLYFASGGARYTALGLLGSVDLSNRWLILLGLHVQRLEGDARNSPIVQDRSNVYANAGIAYRF